MIFDYREPNKTKSPMKNPGKRKKRTSRAVEKNGEIGNIFIFPPSLHMKIEKKTIENAIIDKIDQVQNMQGDYVSMSYM